jgi:uncharacterized membrane protein (UPF0136 family)
MALNLDPVYVVNLILCIIIFLLGILGYKKQNNMTPLLVGVAFGLFGVSHLVTILGYKNELESALIVIRTIAYFTVVFALYKFLRHNQKKG